ncbi:msrA [Symbiodinium microadriaticum]|nr:msrA [Symbiodinium microadriaticum]
MGPAGAKENPTYVEVCSGSTGHVEVYHVEFGGGESELSLEKMYEELVRFFFQFHDSTTTNRQEQDVGTQYASCIFVYDDKQREIAERVRSDFQSHLTAGRVGGMAEDQVKTVIFDATVFFPAHEEHQEYLAKNQNGYCNHRIRFPAWPEPCEP